MAKTNTEPSGMRDFLPLDVLRRNDVIDVIDVFTRATVLSRWKRRSWSGWRRCWANMAKEGDQLIFRVLSKRGDKLQGVDQRPHRKWGK